MSHPVGDQEGFEFVEIAVIKNQQEPAAVRAQPLNRMWNAGREQPQIALGDIGDETFCVAIYASDSRVAIEHHGPFGGDVPMKFADAASGKPHFNTGDCFGDGKFSGCDLAGPAAAFEPLSGKGKRIFEWRNSSTVSFWRPI